MRPFKHFASLLAFFSMAGLSCQELSKSPVFISYGKVNPDLIRDHKYVVLEPDVFTAFQIGLVRESNEWVLGYISLGEVSDSRSYYAQLKDKTLGKNEIWDSYYLDLSDDETQEILLEVVDSIQAKGFNGLFLDTVDVFGPWGNSPEQADHLAVFLAKIKAKYPDFHLMQNSGIALMPKNKEYINSLALESVVTAYDFEQMKYAMRKQKGARERATSLKSVIDDYRIPVVVIEYANTKRMYRRVERQLESLGWDFFIGQIELDSFPKFK